VQASGKINSNTLYRILIFIFIGVMAVLSSICDLMSTPCLAESPRVRPPVQNKTAMLQLHFQNYTYRCSLAIMAIFMFLRVPNILKLLLSVFSLVFYTLIIFGVLSHQAISLASGSEEGLSKMFFKVTIPVCIFKSFVNQTESFGYDIWTESENHVSHLAFLVMVVVYFYLADRCPQHCEVCSASL
jgi:hypothetical protein